MKKFICGLLVGCGLSSACFGVYIGASSHQETAAELPPLPDHGSYIYVQDTITTRPARKIKKTPRKPRSKQGSLRK